MGGHGGFGGGFNSGMGGFGGGMPSSATMDYIHCQYCNRRYNEEAYNKHFNGCKRRAEEAKLREKFVKKPVAKKVAVKKPAKKAAPKAEKAEAKAK